MDCWSDRLDFIAAIAANVPVLLGGCGFFFGLFLLGVRRKVQRALLATAGEQKTYHDQPARKVAYYENPTLHEIAPGFYVSGAN